MISENLFKTIFLITFVLTISWIITFLKILSRLQKDHKKQIEQFGLQDVTRIGIWLNPLKKIKAYKLIFNLLFSNKLKLDDKLDNLIAIYRWLALLIILSFISMTSVLLIK